MEKNVVHVVGTGTIGEPLIGLMASFREKLGIDEITFHKRTPLVDVRSTGRQYQIVKNFLRPVIFSALSL